jgi:hypothetical protein
LQEHAAYSQTKKTTSGLDIGSQGFPGIWVSLQWMWIGNWPATAAEEKFSSSWLVVMLGCLVPHVEMYER